MEGSDKLVCWEGRIGELGDELDQLVQELREGEIAKCCEEDLDYLLDVCVDLLKVCGVLNNTFKRDKNEERA